MATVLEWVGPLYSRDHKREIDEQTETLVYRAVMDKPTADPETDILLSPLCPSILNLHPFNNRLVLISLVAKQIEDIPQAYDCSLFYSSKIPSDGLRQNGKELEWIENPLQRPAVINYGTYKTREVVEWAYDNNDRLVVPIITGAGEPIIVDEEVSSVMISIQKNIVAISPVFAKSGDYINQDNVRINGITYEPYTLFLTDMQIGTLTRENGFLFYPLSFNLYYREKTWIRMLRNAGYQHVTTVPRKRDPNVDDDLLPKFAIKVKPILLNGVTVPSVPVPLRADGTIDPELKKYLDLEAIPGDTTREPLSAEKLQAIYEQSKLYFRTRKRIKFTNTIPLK